MDLSGVSSTTNSADTTSRNQLASNFDTFLTLLTSQLKNQDPLSPMDSTQFTQQLVQFSQVEQQIKTNEQLTGLVSQYQAASAGAALSYLGRDAVVEADTTRLSNGQANWNYSLPSAADSVDITVRNSSGVDVYTTTGVRGAGTHAFSWDGTTSSGQTSADGNYQIVVTAKASDGTAITPTITVRENISGVDFSGTAPQIITASGSRGLDTVRAVLDPS